MRREAQRGGRLLGAMRFAVMFSATWLCAALAGCGGAVEGEAGDGMGEGPLNADGAVGDGGFLPDAVPDALPEVQCEATDTCITPGMDLCAAIQGAATGDRIVVAGDETTPYAIGDCVSAAPNAAEVPNRPTDVTIVGASGHRPTLVGALIIYGAKRWLLEGLHFTTDVPRDTLLRFVGGDGFRVTRCELSGGGGFTQLSIAHDNLQAPVNYGAPMRWRIDHNYFHDNPGNPAHEATQDHLVYVIGGAGIHLDAVIEENLFVGCPHGPAVKLGSTQYFDGDGTSGIVVRRNTVASHGNGNIILAVITTNIRLEGNLLLSTPAGNGNHIFLGSWLGSGIVTADNAMWGYDPEGWPSPAPLLMATISDPIFQQPVYERIDLNQNTNYLAQSGNVRLEPAFVAPTAGSAGCDAYPPIVTGGKTYGASGCPLQ